MGKAEDQRKYRILHPESKIRDREWRKQNCFRAWAMNTIRTHRERGIEVLIKRKELEEFAQNHLDCMLCGEHLVWGEKNYNKRSPSLDLLNPNKSMTIENIWIVCRECNTSKNDRTLEEFIKYCESIVKRFTVTPSIYK